MDELRDWDQFVWFRPQIIRIGKASDAIPSSSRDSFPDRSSSSLGQLGHNLNWQGSSAHRKLTDKGFSELLTASNSVSGAYKFNPVSAWARITTSACWL